ncbi:hypothetical protein, partial [Mycobacterium tuberculosis]|uniref:hypothetical protein n=1 Tax=Mycobacterium tuberculosis TaxID=1773 RepID=UPI002551A2CE
MGSNSSKLRADFISNVLLSRRRHLLVPLSVEKGKPVKDPICIGNYPVGSKEVMESCPRKDIEGFKDKLVEENLYLITE